VTCLLVCSRQPFSYVYSTVSFCYVHDCFLVTLWYIMLCKFSQCILPVAVTTVYKSIILLRWEKKQIRVSTVLTDFTEHFILTFSVQNLWIFGFPCWLKLSPNFVTSVYLSRYCRSRIVGCCRILWRIRFCCKTNSSNQVTVWLAISYWVKEGIWEWSGDTYLTCPIAVA